MQSQNAMKYPAKLGMTILLVITGVLVSLPASACPNKHCVRVGSWNVAWFGGDKREQKVDAETINDMANKIAKQWSIDVIALEEINTSIDGQYRGGQYSTKPWKMLKSALEKLDYETAEGNSGQGQRIVLAWKKNIAVKKSVHEINIPDSYSLGEYCRSSNLRRPLAGLFRADQFDFWVVALHLKSGYGGQTHCTDDIRSLQANYLVKAFSGLEVLDKDIVVVGDFNATGSHKSLVDLRTHGFVPLTSKAYRLENSSNKSQGKGKYGKMLDHIMIIPKNTTEWEKRSTEIYKPVDPERFYRTYSDHYPVWTDFDTQQDDD
jgi:endonuclease/exonuclease/phosphatase family metal-dependent hydrolase